MKKTNSSGIEPFVKSAAARYAAAVFLLFGIFVPIPSAAKTDLILLDRETADPNLQLISDTPAALERAEDGVFIRKTQGDVYLIYPKGFGRRDYNELDISIRSSANLELTVIADISTTGDYTYELQQALQPTDEFQRLVFSLRHSLFDQVEDFGIKFYSAENQADIVLERVVLSKSGLGSGFVQFFKDYFQVAPYTPSTVNVIPTPRIFGHSAFVYALPVFALLACLLFFRKYRRKALLALLALWLITDMRMNYEFFHYQRADYSSWVKPQMQDRTLRTYEDVYVFADWLKTNLPAGLEAVNFYSTNDHFPRVLRYYLYPLRVSDKGEARADVVFHRPDLLADYQTKSGEIIATYADGSFIFLRN